MRLRLCLEALLVALSAVAVSGQPMQREPQYNPRHFKPSENPCYDAREQTQRCVPDFINAAFNLAVEMTNTCGVRQPTRSTEADECLCMQKTVSLEVTSLRDKLLSAARDAMIVVGVNGIDHYDSSDEEVRLCSGHPPVSSVNGDCQPNVSMKKCAVAAGFQVNAGQDKKKEALNKLENLAQLEGELHETSCAGSKEHGCDVASFFNPETDFLHLVFAVGLLFFGRHLSKLHLLPLLFAFASPASAVNLEELLGVASTTTNPAIVKLAEELLGVASTTTNPVIVKLAEELLGVASITPEPKPTSSNEEPTTANPLLAEVVENRRRIAELEALLAARKDEEGKEEEEDAEEVEDGDSRSGMADDDNSSSDTSSRSGSGGSSEPPRKKIKKVQDTSFVYFLADSWELKIFYVGVGTKSGRPLGHLGAAVAASASTSNKKLARIKEIWKSGDGVIIFRAFRGTRSEALLREAALIEAIGLDKLTNMVHGSAPEWRKSDLKKLGSQLLAQARTELDSRQSSSTPLEPIREKDVPGFLIHTADKMFACCNCERVFASSSTLKTHERTHSGEKPYKCSECEMSFRHGNSLQSHKRTHSGEKPYKCSECEMSFRNSNGLQYHERTHSGDKPYKCNECEMSFRHSSTLKNHERTHSGDKPYKCNECEMSFSQRGSLKSHERTHSGDKPYKCSECELSFRHGSTLQVHKRTHSGEKPYKCSECEMSFKQIGGLKNHERTHSEEKPYKCSGCEMSFNQIGNLKRHEKSKHN